MVLSKEIFNNENFDSNLVKQVGKRLENSEYSDALKSALIYLTERIREKTELHDLDGEKLVTTAFSPNNPIIKINNFITESDKSEQKGIMQILQGIYSAFRNPLNHSNIIINEIDCIKKLIIIDTVLSYVNIVSRRQNVYQQVLFDKVSNDNLQYYLERPIDNDTQKSLTFNNLWLHGPSGVGKTNVALRYMIKENRKFYHSLYFASIANIDEALIFLFEDLVDRLENENVEFIFKETDNINRKIKKLFSFLSQNFETVTIHLDEIYEFKEKDFHKFFYFFLDVFKNNTYECNFLNFNLIVTTILDPNEYLITLNRQNDIEKTKELFNFLYMPTWNDNELLKLFDLIEKEISEEIKIDNLLDKINKRPRDLKQLIKQKMIG